MVAVAPLVRIGKAGAKAGALCAGVFLFPGTVVSTDCATVPFVSTASVVFLGRS